jgi:cyclopropane fatty-acyl-phospholipid synthase-like methyltransferase
MPTDNTNATQLNQLTKEFYEQCAKYWNNSPEYEWAGWSLLQNVWKNGTSVLDLGCGSGRFGHYLGRQGELEISSYTAVDATDFYVQHVKSHPVSGITHQSVIQQDLFTESWSTLPTADIVVAFGLLHHVPIAYRPHFFTELYNILNSNSKCILTTWQYLDNPRLKKKILQDHELQVKDSESTDNILSWTVGQYGERYSHHWEIEEVIETAAKYKLQATFLPNPSEAENGLNNYFLIQKI